MKEAGPVLAMGDTGVQRESISQEESKLSPPLPSSYRLLLLLLLLHFLLLHYGN